MNHELTWRAVRRPLLLGAYAQVGAIGTALMVTAVYAFLLAARARGTPSQALINEFAASSSPWVMAATGMVLTFLLGRRVVREMQEPRIAAALLLGVTSAVITTVPSFVLRGRPGLRTLLITACVVLASWAGGTLGARDKKASSP